MRDAQCVAFLQWALPRLGLHWPGYRKVRDQVCKRVQARLKELGLSDVAGYQTLLERSPPEWTRLEAMCPITISRFCRDRAVFDDLARVVLPGLAAAARQRGEGRLRCWCAGCACGEEVYSLRLVWDMQLAARYPELDLELLGTDSDAQVLARARNACYPRSSLREAQADWLGQAFAIQDSDYCMRPEFRHHIAFELQDIRHSLPEGPFELILCRNLVLTYFAPDLRRAVLTRMVARLRPQGALVVGMHERLPEGCTGLEPWPGCRACFRRGGDGAGDPQRLGQPGWPARKEKERS
jgi:chemotaxis protein methyltransferase CheR